jgi:predicted small metal-binding protein
VDTGPALSQREGPIMKEAGLMERQVNCECGYAARDDDEDRLVKSVLEHVTASHPELVDQVTPDVVRGWIELVP